METTKKITMDQASSALMVIKALSEAIREAGKIPQGHLYAMVMDHMSLHLFEGAVRLLVRAGLVRSSSGYVLEWIGPSKEEDARLDDTLPPPGASSEWVRR
jgi:hypothetical protein